MQCTTWPHMVKYNALHVQGSGPHYVIEARNIGEEGHFGWRRVYVCSAHTSDFEARGQDEILCILCMFSLLPTCWGKCVGVVGNQCLARPSVSHESCTVHAGSVHDVQDSTLVICFDAWLQSSNRHDVYIMWYSTLHTGQHQAWRLELLVTCYIQKTVVLTFVLFRKLQTWAFS